MAIRHQLPARVFTRDEFIGIDLPETPFMAVVESLVYPSAEDIAVEIVSIKTQVGDTELACFLRRDIEWILKPLIRSSYLLEARAGYEGDAHVEEIA